MALRLGRWVRAATGLIKYRRLIGVHGSARVLAQGEFEFGRRVSIGPWSLIQIPRNARLRLGNGVSIGRQVEVTPAAAIEIGDFTSVQDRCIFLGEVEIGANCVFAPNVYMSSGTHRFMEKPAWLIRDQDALVADPNYEAKSPRHLPIRVHDDCWLGINVVVMRGVTIGRGSVVGANSVVTRSVDPYSVVAGAPARLIRHRLEFRPPRSISSANPADLPYFYSGFDLRQCAIPSPGAGLKAHGRFHLALDCKEAASIRIDVESGEPVSLAYRDDVRSLSAGRQSARFQLQEIPGNGLISMQVSDARGRPCTISVHGASAES